MSNAPASVMYLAHSGFLYFNGFPYGSLLFRDSIFAENHKVETIKNLIAEEAPELVIMIGDNGEIDSQVYSEIEKYFSKSGIKFYSFIHQVYSTKAISEKGKPLMPGHHGFVTSLDLGVSLNRAGLLSAENFLSFWEKASGEIIFERSSFFDSKVFPLWLDCADYYREKNISKQYLGTHLTDLLSRKCR